MYKKITAGTTPPWSEPAAWDTTRGIPPIKASSAYQVVKFVLTAVRRVQTAVYAGEYGFGGFTQGGSGDETPPRSFPQSLPQPILLRLFAGLLAPPSNQERILATVCSSFGVLTRIGNRVVGPSGLSLCENTAAKRDWSAWAAKKSSCLVQGEAESLPRQDGFDLAENEACGGDRNLRRECVEIEGAEIAGR